MAKNFKEGKSESKTNLALRRGASNQYVSNAHKVTHEGGGGFQIVTPTRSTSGKKHFVKSHADSSRCYGCWNNDHNVRDCPTIASSGRDVNESPYNFPIVGEEKKNH